MNEDPSGLWWAVVDVLFVGALGLAIALANMLQPRGDGSLAVSTESLKPPPDVRATGRYGRWQEIVMLLIGLWLCVQPVVFPDEVTQGMSANAIIVGTVLGALALAALYRLEAPHEWALVLAGAWIFVSPWILGFSDTPRTAWSHWISGLAVVVLASWELIALRKMPTLTRDTSPSARRRRRRSRA
jgi:hypothetical protein